MAAKKSRSISFNLIKSLASLFASPQSQNTEKNDNDKTETDHNNIRKIVGLRSLADIKSPITVIFIHYHPNEYVSPGFAKLVQSACQSGFRAIFVSSSRPSKILSQIGNCPGLACIHRHNRGYDFGSLKDARDTIRKHGLDTEGRYVVVNSSMLNLASEGFGKDPILDQLTRTNDKNDLLGITASYEKSIYHIQTFFYSVSSHLFNSEDFERFLQRYENGLQKTKLSPRDYAIKYGELSLSKFAINAGYKVDSIFSDFCLPSSKSYAEIESIHEDLQKLIPAYDSLDWSSSHPLASNPLKLQSEWLPRLGMHSNPVQSCWSLMLKRQFFFIKRELLEFSHPDGHHSPSVVALLLPVLETLNASIPEWSDLHYLPYITHSSKGGKKRNQ